MIGVFRAYDEEMALNAKYRYNRIPEGNDTCLTFSSAVRL